MLIVVGLGGNLGDTLSAFASAVHQLAQRFPVRATSGVWQTEPIGPAQPDFLNAALLLELDAHPSLLLTLCHELEMVAGRDRSRAAAWGPRPLDLDLLIAESSVTVSPMLVLPHPSLHERRFALAPAVEIVPGWRHQRLRRTLGELVLEPSVAAQRCHRLGPFPSYER